MAINAQTPEGLLDQVAKAELKRRGSPLTGENLSRMKEVLSRDSSIMNKAVTNAGAEQRTAGRTTSGVALADTQKPTQDAFDRALDKSLMSDMPPQPTAILNSAQQTAMPPEISEESPLGETRSNDNEVVEGKHVSAAPIPPPMNPTTTPPLPQMSNIPDNTGLLPIMAALGMKPVDQSQVAPTIAAPEKMRALPPPSEPQPTTVKAPLPIDPANDALSLGKPEVSATEQGILDKMTTEQGIFDPPEVLMRGEDGKGTIVTLGDGKLYRIAADGSASGMSPVGKTLEQVTDPSLLAKIMKLAGRL